MARINILVSDEKQMEIKIEAVKLQTNMSELMLTAYEYYIDMIRNTPDQALKGDK